MRFSFSEITRVLGWGPAMTRSIASSSSSSAISLRPWRADRRAASLTTLARSAPVNPGGRRAQTPRAHPAAGRQEGGLVDHVGQVGAGEPGGPAGQDLEVDPGGEGLAAGVDLEDVQPALEVGPGGGELAG